MANEGEIKGVRERGEALAQRIRECGGTAQYAEKKSKEAMQRLDRNIRTGRCK